MSNKLDGLITDIEAEIEQLEQGREAGATVDAEAVYELDAVEQQARDSSYRLSTEDMGKAAAISSVFADTVSELPYAEVEQMLKQAQKDGDKVTLYLLSKHSPHEGIRSLAKGIGTDEGTLAKVATARSLYVRLRQLRSMSPYQRQELARSLGHTVQEAKEQEDNRTEQDHYEALKADYSYSL